MSARMRVRDLGPGEWERRARYWHAVAQRAVKQLRGRGVEEIPGPRDNPASAEDIARATRSYRLTHWGLKGDGEAHGAKCADPRGVLTHLGLLREITYETTKAGDDGPTFYEHPFSKRAAPELAYSRRGLLVICGGKYKVSWRGIVDD